MSYYFFFGGIAGESPWDRVRESGGSQETGRSLSSWWLG